MVIVHYKGSLINTTFPSVGVGPLQNAPYDNGENLKKKGIFAFLV